MAQRDAPGTGTDEAQAEDRQQEDAGKGVQPQTQTALGQAPGLGPQQAARPAVREQARHAQGTAAGGPRGPNRSASRVVAGVGRAKASSPRPAALTASTHRASKIRNMSTLRHSDRQSTRCGPAVVRTASVKTFLAAWSERSFPGDLQRPCRTDRRTPCPSRVYGCASVPAGTDPPASPSPGGASIYEFDRSGGGGALSAQRRLRARRYPLFRTRTSRPDPCGSARRNRRWSFSGLLPAGPWAPSPGPRGPG